jgi:endonuclease/exonuclease/phosphatase (EEP) superfamily protein YafD
MKRTFRSTYIRVAWLYSGLFLGWFALRIGFGETLWWLVPVNAAAPYLFMPVLPLLLIGTVFRLLDLMAPIAPVLLIFISLYGQQFMPGRLAEVVRGEQDLIVMTFNIWGGSRTPETAAVIADNGFPDVVAIQELTPAMVRLLDETLGDAYPYRALDVREQELGLGIFSRHPLMALNTSHLADPAWRVQAVKVWRGDTSFVLYNVHLHGIRILPYWQEDLDLAEEVRRNRVQRLTVAYKLLDDLAGRVEPVIVAGDFNSTDQSDVYQVLTRRLADAHQRVGWGFGHTFPADSLSYLEVPLFAHLRELENKLAGKVPWRVDQFKPTRLLRIDMILYTPEFTAVKSRVSAQHGASDHLPVLATLR